jgi:transaldolase
MPEETLKSVGGHTELGELLPTDGGNCEDVLRQFAEAGVDVEALASQLQDEGTKSFVKSWDDLTTVISSKGGLIDKGASLRAAG